jgi:hypothetical protein
VRHSAIVTLCLLGGSPAAFAQTPDVTGSDDPAEAAVVRVLGRFQDPEASWADRLAEFEKFEKDFPQSKYAKGVKASVATLRRMVAEEKARAVGPHKPENLLTKRERISDLILQLRDEWEILSRKPRINRVPEDMPGQNAGSPAYQLAGMGFDAVPQLIDALDDEQFSRSVADPDDFDCTRNILRVGDCSRVVLELIAGRDFGRDGARAAMVKSGELPAVKRRVLAWWAEARVKGEKRMLVEGVAGGNEYSPRLAERLVAKYPDAALAAIRVGVRAAANGWNRARLVDAAAGLKGEELLDFLREELRGPPHRGPTVAAARALLRRGNREGIPAMIREWQRLRRDSDRNAISSDWNARFEGPDALFEFLADSRDAAAIRAMAVGLRNHPVKVRAEVVWRLGLLGTGEGEKPLPDDFDDEVESLLVAALGDGELCWGQSGTCGRDSPAVGELAALQLTRRQRRPTEFSFTRPLREVDAERLELTNDWRNRKGLAPLPAPAHWSVKCLDARQLRPLLAQLEQAPGAAERRAAADKIEAKGVAAIPALQDELRLLPADAPGAAELKALAGRLTFRVVHVRTDVDPSLSRALVRTMEGLRGKPVSERAVLDLLLFATRETPPGTRLELHVHRTGNQTGAELFFRALPEGKPLERSPHLNASRSVTVDREIVLQKGLFLPRATGTAEEDWGDLMEAVREAFAATPGQEIVFRVQWFSSR